MWVNNVLVLEILYIILGKGYTWTCPGHAWTSVFTRLADQPVLTFGYKFPTSPTSTDISIKDSQDVVLLQLVYENGTMKQPPVVNGCQFLGNTNADYISIRLDPVTSVNISGVYRLVESNQPAITSCITLHLLGTPTTPILTVQTSTPSEGDAAMLNCSSISTTVPANHSLQLFYNWWINGIYNPESQKYSFSTYKRTLVVNNVTKADSKTRFSCVSTEDVIDGFTSLESDTLSFDILYGPDNIRFNPQGEHISAIDGTVFDVFNCEADCYPICHFGWTKVSPGDQIPVSNSKLLDLGIINEGHAGEYRCSVNREGGFSATKSLIIQVVYAPPIMPLFFQCITLIDKHPAFVWEKHPRTLDSQYFLLRIMQHNDTDSLRNISVHVTDTTHLISGRIFVLDVDNIQVGNYTATLSSVNDFFQADPTPLSVQFDVTDLRKCTDGLQNSECQVQNATLYVFVGLFAVVVVVMTVMLVVFCRKLKCT